jgi:hypothetical protein
LGAQIGSCRGKVFGKEASSSGATSFRKAAVSAVHKSNKEFRGDLADLMVHNKNTADRYYLLQDTGKSAVKTSKNYGTLCAMNLLGKMGAQTIVLELMILQIYLCLIGTTGAVRKNMLYKSLFSQNIEAKQILIREVRKISKDHPLLGKIRDKIRTYFEDETGMDEDPPMLPKEETVQQKLKD